MHIEFWPIKNVIPYAGNPRQIPPAAVDKVASSIKEFSWRQPIVVDAFGVIIVGHTRLLAAQQLGLAEVPVHVAAGLSPAQVRALRLMDNRSHEESSWNLPLLGAELLALKHRQPRPSAVPEICGVVVHTGCCVATALNRNKWGGCWRAKPRWSWSRIHPME